MVNTSKRIILLLFLILSLCFSSFAGEPENYCKDKKSWEKWDSLIKKYPLDNDIHILHALRLGLCLKIEQGSITLERATELFERAHRIIIEKKRSEELTNKPDSM